MAGEFGALSCTTFVQLAATSGRTGFLVQRGGAFHPGCFLALLLPRHWVCLMSLEGSIGGLDSFLESGSWRLGQGIGSSYWQIAKLPENGPSNYVLPELELGKNWS